MNLELDFTNCLFKKPNQFMTEYLRELKSLTENLATINCAISDKDLVIQSLNDLSQDYDPFVTTITNKKSSTSFSKFHAKLLKSNEFSVILGLFTIQSFSCG